MQVLICYKTYLLNDLEMLQTNKKNSKSTIFCRRIYSYHEKRRTRVNKLSVLIWRNTRIHFITKCLLKDKIAVVEYLSQWIPTTTKFYDIICHIQCCKCCLFLWRVLFKVVTCVWRSCPWTSTISKVESFQNIAHTRTTLVISWLFANVLLKGALILI